jgi:NADH-quinone oxidoreductase subunit A
LRLVSEQDFEGRKVHLALALLQREAGQIGYGTMYVYVGLFLLLVVGFVATTLVIARLIAPSRRSSRAKGQIYETGEVTVTDPWRPFPVRYYVFALLFLIFDVEAAFLYPWATIYKDYIAQGMGLYMFVEVAIFVFILVVGLTYAWKKGALKWV